MTGPLRRLVRDRRFLGLSSIQWTALGAASGAIAVIIALVVALAPSGPSSRPSSELEEDPAPADTFHTLPGTEDPSGRLGGDQDPLDSNNVTEFSVTGLVLESTKDWHAAHFRVRNNTGSDVDVTSVALISGYPWSCAHISPPQILFLEDAEVTIYEVDETTEAASLALHVQGAIEGSRRPAFGTWRRECDATSSSISAPVLVDVEARDFTDLTVVFPRSFTVSVAPNLAHNEEAELAGGTLQLFDFGIDSFIEVHLALDGGVCDVVGVFQLDGGEIRRIPDRSLLSEIVPYSIPYRSVPASCGSN